MVSGNAVLLSQLPSAVDVYAHGPPSSSAHQYLSHLESQPSHEESDLLKSVRAALRGTALEPKNAIHSTCFESEGDPWNGFQLTWNDRSAALSSGGVLRKRWDFEVERQNIQWACFGWLEQFAPKADFGLRDYTYPTSFPHLSKSSFGPFTLSERPAGYSETVKRIPTVFVFLRTKGMAFLQDGTRYTFTVPYIVRRAWPISPFGVMIQRQVHPQELVEAERSGEEVLPTIFALVNPITEVGALGVTAGIIGGPDDVSARLIDEEEKASSHLVTVPPSEALLWVSQRSVATSYQVAVTVDEAKHSVSIWRYAYIKAKDAPRPAGRELMKERARKRRSMSMAGLKPPADILQERRDETTKIHAFLPDIHSLASLPGMPAALAATVDPVKPSTPSKTRRDSFNRHDLSVTLDKMVLGSRLKDDMSFLPPETGRMKTSFWAQRLSTHDISEADAESWRSMSVAIFDHRWDGNEERALLAVSLPHSKSSLLFSVSEKENRTMHVNQISTIPAVSFVSICSTRPAMHDLLILKPDHSLALLCFGVNEVPISVIDAPRPDDSKMNVDNSREDIVSLEAGLMSSMTLVHRDGRKSEINVNMIPQNLLAVQVLQVLSLYLPENIFFAIHRIFLLLWCKEDMRYTDGIEFRALKTSLCLVCGVTLRQKNKGKEKEADPWTLLDKSTSKSRFRNDPVLRLLKQHPPRQKPEVLQEDRPILLAPVLYALHTLGEDLRLTVDHYRSLQELVDVICRIAWIIRPEWADYWRRLCPCNTSDWPYPSSAHIEYVEDRIPAWPPDISAILYGRISNPEWDAKVPWQDASGMAARFNIRPAFAFGRKDPLESSAKLTEVYKCLADKTVAQSQKRAENAVYFMVTSGIGPDFLDRLPLGLASPLREAIRTCQLTPPIHWPPSVYRAIGREDVAASAVHNPDILAKDGYRPIKDFIGNNAGRRRTMSQIIVEARTLAFGEIEAVSGVELDLDDFTDIRFGQDRRLEDVARLLNSAYIQTYRPFVDRPDAGEVDQNKEFQHQALRIAERTNALAYGRAMFTFGSVLKVSRQAYTIPIVNYTIRIHPHNVHVVPDVKLLHQDSIHWGEFHNGVAAGLRISSATKGVESSWIAFNKPNDLSPSHAGFLFGLGLSGHLKEMVAWNTFQYLTPKHDITSIGVLLGLAAANVGSGNASVTKLLAVHTPALLPTPDVDLNITLMTQSAGLIGMGLLYLGTKHRRYAEVCLREISRKDLFQPDLHNEYRETYTTSAALAFGLIMLGKGTMIPADVEMVRRMNFLIQGDEQHSIGLGSHPSFDLNLTCPAATMALGLMYLRTGRKDIADMLPMPDTILALNSIQPSFLLTRVLARSLILWGSIEPTTTWLTNQIPETIRAAIKLRFESGAAIDDALELAYYNIIAGCCFAVGLKYAGTARQEAYKLIIRYFDLFTRMVYSNGPNFDHRIKRSAVRDGLNLISIALSMVMAGTGEITSFRRLRYAYGMFNQTMYHPTHKYGIHVATYQAIGLLFLGAGRYTLGTSDAAIASMVIAFYPRFHQVSSDNKVYLQALRHLWVLAAEPRCLVARDVETKEVVYLPLKITVRDGTEMGTTQLISPTLIPEMDKVMSIRVDTPRYWPFHLDLERVAQHRESLVRSQTLYVKRRTAFLSYTEDPRGSRSLFVRSRSSAGEAAILDFPQLTTKSHPASDLSEFINSFSNDPVYLSFADHFSSGWDGDTEEESLFTSYCHAALYDSILQGKPQSLQSHLMLWVYRRMGEQDLYFHLRMQDLRFAADFYSRIYDRRFSGRSENNARIPLIRDSTVMGALHALDERLDVVRKDPGFLEIFAAYTVGAKVPLKAKGDAERLGWYLLRNMVPVSTVMQIMKGLASDAYAQCFGRPEGTFDARLLDEGIKEVLHATGSTMATSLGTGWSVRSLDETVELWKDMQQQQ
ncbi:hypothetical protein IW262DRAFT_1276839 [Armillaria fumosa]|nr:hypothetical protein IW262DRAFT_1276839 [Armillaria fumosa]